MKLEPHNLLANLQKKQSVALVDEKGVRIDPAVTERKADATTNGRSELSGLAAQIPTAWRELLRKEFTRPYFLQLEQAVDEAYGGAAGTVFPPREQLFRALELVPSPEAVRVVIIGQDPYVRAGQAHGLSFSMQQKNGGAAGENGKQQWLPPSLANIITELTNEYNNDFKMLQGGDLSGWATQGVLLLNSVLSVAQGEPNSHSEFGWKSLTDRIIELVVERAQPGVVFLLWGAAAKEKATLIGGAGNHHILRAAHPSPKSADSGFFGCGHFVRCNQLLAARGAKPIEWGVRKGGAPLKHTAAAKVSSLASFAVESTLDAEFANVVGRRKPASDNDEPVRVVIAGEEDSDDDCEYGLDDPEEEMRRKRARLVPNVDDDLVVDDVPTDCRDSDNKQQE